jgi:ATP-binding cassette, subfamily B, multidrug efflux pump
MPSLSFLRERDDLLGGAKLGIKTMPKVLLRLTVLTFHYPARSAAAVACAFGATIFALVTPRLLGSAVDQVHALLAAGAAHPQAAKAILLRTACLIIGASGLRGLLTGLQGFLGVNIAQRVGYDLRLAFFEKLHVCHFPITMRYIPAN